MKLPKSFKQAAERFIDGIRLEGDESEAWLAQARAKEGRKSGNRYSHQIEKLKNLPPCPSAITRIRRGLSKVLAGWIGS